MLQRLRGQPLTMILLGEDTVLRLGDQTKTRRGHRCWLCCIAPDCDRPRLFYKIIKSIRNTIERKINECIANLRSKDRTYTRCGTRSAWTCQDSWFLNEAGERHQFNICNNGLPSEILRENKSVAEIFLLF